MSRPFLPPDDEERLVQEIGRELGGIAGDSGVPAPAGFTDRVMLAVAKEPLPQPARAFGVALLAGRLRAALAALGDAWRVTIGGSTSLGVRGQALAVVMLVAVGAFAVAGGAAMGAMDLLAQNSTAPLPSSTAPVPSDVTPTARPNPSPDPSPSPDASQRPSVETSVEPTTSENPGSTTTPRATLRPWTPSPTATGTDDHGGSCSGNGGSGSGSGSGGGIATPSPTPTATGSDDHGGGDG